MNYKNSVNNKLNIVSELIFIPILVYPPLVFVLTISRPLRVVLFILLTSYLLSISKRFEAKDFIILILLGGVFLISLISNFGNLSGLFTSGSLILTLVFAYALERVADSNNNIKVKLINFYIKFSIMAALGSLISTIFLMTYGEMNVFNIDLGAGYLYTPFGILQYKQIFGIDFFRSMFFFREPAFIGLFYAANIFLVAPNIKEKSKFFLVCNIVGGILTFSYFFVILSTLLFMARYINYSFKTGFILLLLISVLSFFAFDFLASSSLQNRIYRLELFFVVMEWAEFSQIMFGSGFLTEPVLDQNFAAGLAQIIYEIGIVGSIGIIFFTYLTLNLQNKYIFILFFSSMMVFEPIKMPLFWTLLAVLSVLMCDKPKT
jgi:hypothetical protein